MTKIIAVINQKGGVGKTATTCHLAYCFSKKNKAILLIDIDPSANASSFFLNGNTPRFTTKDFLLAKEPSISMILPAYQGIKIVENLSILPSHIGLALTEVHLAGRPFREALLFRKLKDPAFNRYNYIIIDCPPTLSTLTVNAMYCADFILIPVNYQKHALDGIADLFQVLDEIKEGHTYDFRILRNQFDGRKKTVNNFVSEKLSYLEKEKLVLNTIIHQDEAVNRSTLEGLTVFEHCAHATSTKDYQQLCIEMECILNG